MNTHHQTTAQHDQAVADAAATARLAERAKLLDAEKNGGRLSLSDLASANKAAKLSRSQAGSSARKERKEAEFAEQQMEAAAMEAMGLDGKGI